MKKILALLLAGVMTVGLAACGTPADTSGGNSTADNGSAASGDTVVIGVFEPLSETVFAFSSSWAKFARTVPWKGSRKAIRK
mgnify:CR=1 FL=1